MGGREGGAEGRRERERERERESLRLRVCLNTVFGPVSLCVSPNTNGCSGRSSPSSSLSVSLSVSLSDSLSDSLSVLGEPKRKTGGGSIRNQKIPTARCRPLICSPSLSLSRMQVVSTRASPPRVHLRDHWAALCFFLPLPPSLSLTLPLCTCLRARPARPSAMPPHVPPFSTVLRVVCSTVPAVG